MKYYLSWYYWYKNFGDELLLLGLIRYVVQNFSDCEEIYIVSWDVQWWEKWLSDNKKHFQDLEILPKIRVVLTTPRVPSNSNILVLWWWEVLTDERPFPYNSWRNLKYLPRFLQKKVIFVWWIWAPKKLFSRSLYSFLLDRSLLVITREQSSFDVTSQFAEQVKLHRDFAYDILDNMNISVENSIGTKPYILINLNHHIFKQQDLRWLIQEKVAPYLDTHDIYFFPASVWVDDADNTLSGYVQSIFPQQVQIFNWTEHSLSETLSFISWADFVLATRLHVLLVAQHYWVPLHPLVYQEKIQKFIDYSA